jgi:molybdate transport system regulatory protein
METSKLKLIAEFTNGRAVGPGKIQLLEAIEKAGSISQASRNLGMSYRHAWMLVDDMNKCFRNPVIEARPGAPQGGHATLTPLGKKLIEQYRAIEAAAWLATSKHTRFPGAPGLPLVTFGTVPMGGRGHPAYRARFCSSAFQGNH